MSYAERRRRKDKRRDPQGYALRAAVIRAAKNKERESK